MASALPVIGIGSSGIQIVSNIASRVEQFYAWVRLPTWITAGFAQKFAGPNVGNFHCESPQVLVKLRRYTGTDPELDTPEQQKAFAENPELFLKYSKMIESELNVRFKFILTGTKEAEDAKNVRLLPVMVLPLAQTAVDSSLQTKWCTSLAQRSPISSRRLSQRTLP